MTPGKMAALSFEKRPMVWAPTRAASQASLFQVAQQARQHSEGGQQIRPSDDIRHRFDEQGMHCPQCSQRKGRRRASQDHQSQRVYQRNVDLVKRQVDPVIARRIQAVAHRKVIP
jgi:transcriptional regulator of acetoin/glycerol metabolism